MILYPSVLAGLILLVLGAFALDRAVRKMYRNKPTPHTVSPGSLGIPYEDVRCPAEDGGSLHGWWMPGTPGAPVLILLHGWENNAGRLISYIEHLHPLGYNLFSIDARNHGDSSPHPQPTVWSFTQDALAAIRWILDRYGDGAPQIGLIGFSIGGGAAINAAALAPEVQALLTVGAISHPLKVMRVGFDRKGIPYFPLVWMFFKYLELRFRIPFDRIAPIRRVGSIPAPLFLVHGANDTIVPPEQGKELYAAAAQDRAQLWIVPSRGHGDCDEAPGFWDRVTQFLEQSLGPVPD